jgi:uncharacterized protein
MTAEQNKQLVAKTLQALLKGDTNSALANLTDDASWFIVGSLPGVSGLKKGKQGIAAFFADVGRAFPEGLKPEIRRVYCDGNTVIVELTNRAKAATGKQYENDYCFVFEIEGDRIRRVREYVDLLTVKETVLG